MSSETVAKCVGKKLRYYFEVKRLEDGFDLSGVNAPQLNHPPLKSRPTLQYDGLHDRALKHYFSQTDVKAKLTKLYPNDPSDAREGRTKKLLHRYMYKHRFVHPTMPDWMYRHHPTEGKAIKPEFLGFGVGLKKRKKSIKGGYPLLRSVPSQKVTRGEAHRLIDVATKILVATEKVNDMQVQPPRSGKRQTAPQPFEKKKRPSTAKYTWDIHGRRHVRVKERDSQSDDGQQRPLSEKRRAYDDSFIPDWLLKQEERPKTPERTVTPEPKQSPRPKSAKYRQRDPIPPPTPKPTIINMPEPEPEREDVAVNEGTQTADNVGIQTERKLLEEYNQEEDEVKTGPWGEYQIYIQTGDRVGAATKADVRITLYGEKGRTRELTMGKSQRNKVKFQRGKEDLFLEAAHHVGKLRKIKIGHDRPELSYAWYLDGVSVYDMEDKRIYDFRCDGWLSGQDGDKKTYRELLVDSERAFVDSYDDVRGRISPKAGKDRRNKDNSTDSRASKDDKRSIESVQGSRAEDSSDSDTSYSSTSTSSSYSGRRRGRKSKSPKRAETPPKSRELSPPRKAEKDEFFDTKSGPTFTFRSYSEDGKTAEEEYMTGYKAGLEAASSEQKHKEEQEDEERKRVLTGATIHDAARAGNLERMQTLVNYFPEMKEAKDESGLTPLHIATQQGRLEIVKWLTAYGINLNTETRTGYTAIHLAAMNGHVNCMIVLAAMGATLTCRSVDRQMPLHVASMNGHIECVKWLIANRANLEAEDQLGRTPLDLAEEYQHEEVANFIRKCLEEARDPNSSLHAVRTRKGLDTIKEDGGKESPRWQNDTNPDSARANAGSESEGRTSRKKSQDHTEDLEEKRRLYDEQHERMERSGTSFLDSIRDEATY